VVGEATEAEPRAVTTGLSETAATTITAERAVAGSTAGGDTAVAAETVAAAINHAPE